MIYFLEGTGRTYTELCVEANGPEHGARVDGRPRGRSNRRTLQHRPGCLHEGSDASGKQDGWLSRLFDCDIEQSPIKRDAMFQRAHTNVFAKRS